MSGENPPNHPNHVQVAFKYPDLTGDEFKDIVRNEGVNLIISWVNDEGDRFEEKIILTRYEEKK